MNANENQNKDTKRNERNSQNTHAGVHPKKDWDERPGERDSDPQVQQRQREWEEAQKKQQEYAKRPGVDESDLKQHDDEGNASNRGEDFQAGQ